MEWLKSNLSNARRGIRNVCQLVSKYSASRIHSYYRFSINDALLHWYERNWEVPKVTVLDESDDWFQLRIREITFYWPKNFSYQSLPWLFNEVFHDARHNPASYAHEFATIPQNGWVVDGGACEGFFVSFALQHGGGRVIAVEPVPILTAALQRTFSKQQMEQTVTILTAALGKEGGNARLKWNPEESWNAHVSMNRDRAMGEQVRLVTIDEVVEAQHLVGPGFIKLDVEGSEVEALMGARNTLKRLKPKLAVAVYHEYENARNCATIIKETDPSYQTQFRGMYGWFDGPARPYLLFAW